MSPIDSGFHLPQANEIDMQQSWDSLFKPTQFDWADDVEEELEGSVEIDREPERIEETEDIVMEGKTTEEALAPLKIYKNTQAYMYTTTDKPKVTEEKFRGPLIVNGAANTTMDIESWEQETDSGSSTDFDGEIESMQLAVNGEFAYRRACLQADNERFIHHFNWLGAPVYGYNPTPPTISLLFLLTDPKTPPSGDEWRYESIMKRAMVFVDPVIVYVDNGKEDLCKRGFDLVRWATGRVYKFYSPHGKWSEDVRDLEEFPVLDEGNLVNYASDNTVAGNGFIEQFTIKSRSQWFRSRDECYYVAHRQQKPRRKGFGLVSSPLRQSMTPSDFDVEDGKILGYSYFDKNYKNLTSTETEHVEDIVIERPPSRLSLKRSSDKPPRTTVGGLKRRASIRDFKAELASLAGEGCGIGCSRVDDFVQLSDEEKELAEDIKSRKLLKKSYHPVFATVGEEDESPENTDGQDQKQPQRTQYVSTGTQTELSGPVVGSSGVKTVAEVVGLRRGTKRSLAYLSQKNDKVKKGLRRFVNKTRDVLRTEKSQFTLASGSSDSSTSPSTAPGKETGSSATSPVVVVSQADSGFAEQQASSTMRLHHAPEEHGGKLSLKEKMAATMKNFRHSASEPRSPALAEKRSAISEFCENLFYDGIWALEHYPIYPLIL